MPASLTPQQRALRARMGAYAQHAAHDTRETTKAGTAAFLQKFVDQVDPDRVLPAAERQRRAEAARKAYFTGLALKSAKARREGVRTPDAQLPPRRRAAVLTVPVVGTRGCGLHAE